MAVCFTAVAVPSSCNLRRSISLDPSKLSALRSLRSTPLRRLTARSKRLATLPQRRIIPQEGAMPANVLIQRVESALAVS